MKTNRQELLTLMEKYNITAWNVANLLNVSKMTVRIWRCASSRDIPTSKLELLKFKLKENI